MLDSSWTIGVDGNLYLFGEKCLKSYIDDYNKEYYMTKGLNRYYLYMKQYAGGFSLAAATKPAINRFIYDNNLREVE